VFLQARYNKSQVTLAYCSAPFSASAVCVLALVPCHGALVYDVTSIPASSHFSLNVLRLTTEDLYSYVLL
jgi:hypothetical protein